MTRPGVPIVCAALLAGLGCAHRGTPPDPSDAVRPALDPSPAARTVTAPDDRPATHIGRVLLPRTDVIVRGKVTTAMPAAHGVRVGHVLPSEWLRGEPREEGTTLVVLTASADALPPEGRDALFLLSARPGSDNLELVEVSNLADEDGLARLAAMRKYLEIESISDPAARVESLRAYLRGALVADERWTRSNAVREYAALASEMPGTLTVEDRPPLQSALGRTRETALRTLIQTALAECPGTATKAAKAAAPSVARDSLAEPTARFTAKDATLATRRQAVIDAAVDAGAGAAPLIERALDDEAPPVREAAAAAAGQLRIASLEPKIAAMLASDDSPIVRRTLIVAAGYLKSASSVPTLAILAKEGSPFARDAAFALARIRDRAAVVELTRLGADATDGDRRELLEFLLSEHFVEQERALSEKR